MPANQPIWQECVRNGRNVDPVHSLSHHTDRLKQCNCCSTPHSQSPLFSHAPHFPCAPHNSISHPSSLGTVLCAPVQVFRTSLPPCSLVPGSSTLQLTPSLPPSHSVLALSLPVGLSAPSPFSLPTVSVSTGNFNLLVIVSNNSLKTKTPESSPVQRASTVIIRHVGGKGTLKQLHQSCMQKATEGQWWGYAAKGLSWLQRYVILKDFFSLSVTLLSPRIERTTPWQMF